MRRIFYFIADFTTYLAFYLRRHAALDFVSMGLGIRARYRRNASEWQPHIEQSHRFLLKALERINGTGEMAVLGAGRLYDFPLAALEDKPWKIDLYDYDPSLRRLWFNLRDNSKVIRDFYFEDLTGVLETWSRRLALLPRTVRAEEFARELRLLPARHPAKYQFAAKYRCIISLNILSQLGLYWRDRVEQALRRYKIQLNDDGTFPSVIESAVVECVRALEEAHRRSIEEARPELAIIICDRAYLYYRDDATRCSEVPALTTPVTVAAYTNVEQDSWHWHIAPRGTEHHDYGEIHEVIASAFTLHR